MRHRVIGSYGLDCLLRKAKIMVVMVITLISITATMETINMETTKAATVTTIQTLIITNLNKISTGGINLLNER
jgi:hypothetical protein